MPAIAWLFALSSALVPLDDAALVEARGVTAVRAHCVACHSARLITQNRGTAAQWYALLRWMQEENGLWPLAPQTEREIVSYLARHYGPEEAHRRAPLPAHLRPPPAPRP